MITKTIPFNGHIFQHFVTILTTGFFPKTSHLIGIGLLIPYSNDSKLHLYLSEEVADETLLFSTFSQTTTDNLSIIGYNVKQYTLPFMKERAAVLGLSLPACTWQGLREEVSARRSLDSRLADETLHTAAAWATFRPSSTIAPSDVPGLWEDFRQSKEPVIAEVLLQHMTDDLLGMAQLSTALKSAKQKDAIVQGDFTFYPLKAKLLGDRLCVTGEINPPLSGYFVHETHELQCCHNHFSLTLQGQEASYDGTIDCIFVDFPWEETIPQTIPAPNAITLLAFDGKVQKEHLLPVIRHAFTRFFTEI